MKRASAAVILATLWTVACHNPPEPRPFSADAWQSGSARDRYAMHQSLLDLDTLRGLSRAEVVALLGPPDWETPGVDPVPDVVQEGAMALLYNLNTGSIFKDPNLGNPVIQVPLVVRLNSATGQVEEVYVAGWEY